MTFRELVRFVSEGSGATQTATRDVLTALAMITADELAAGGRVELPGFGAFDVRTRKARFVNLNFGPAGADEKRTRLPAVREPRFRAEWALKAAVRR
jgi:DNA-binding protein HU-beta